MKSLETLIKLQKTRVDEQRRLLARLQDRLEEIEDEITRHIMEQATEQANALENPAFAITYAAYVIKALEKSKRLEKQKNAAEVAVNFARDKLAELFEEQKRYEIAQAERVAAELKEEMRKDRIALDEVGSVQYERHKHGSL